MPNARNNDEYSSHDSVVHDSIRGLGWDWERVAYLGDEAKLAPRYPMLVAFPKSTSELEAAIKAFNAAKAAGLINAIKVRSKGHSSNGIVLGNNAYALISMELMRESTEVLAKLESPQDSNDPTILLPAGRTFHDIQAPRPEGIGADLIIVGDHGEITPGGFASIGGVGAAAHRHGMFIDNVLELTLVDYDGNVRTLTRKDHPHALDAVLAGRSRHGVISELRVRRARYSKRATVLEATTTPYFTFGEFLQGTGKDWGDRMYAERASIFYQRAAFVRIRNDGNEFTLGTTTHFTEPQQPLPANAPLLAAMLMAPLRMVGRIAGTTGDDATELMLRRIGVAGLLFTPTYSTAADIEAFSDIAIDSATVNPMRMLSMTCHCDVYDQCITTLVNTYNEVMETEGSGMLQWALTTKVINSPYLLRRAGLDKDPENGHYFRELTFYCWSKKALASEHLDRLVDTFDLLCTNNRNMAFRYLHTTSNARDSNGEISAEVDLNIPLPGP